MPEIVLSEFLQPQDLNQARTRVLAVPGIEHYVPDRSAKPEVLDGELDRMIEDVTLQLDASNGVSMITHLAGWSDKQAQQFFSDPDRQPYKTPLIFSEEFGERARELTIIGAYMRERYSEA